MSNKARNFFLLISSLFSLGANAGMTKTFYADASLDCASASKILGAMLGGHLIYDHLDEVVFERALNGTVDRLAEEFKGVLTASHVAALKQVIATANREAVAAGLSDGSSCALFESEQAIVENAHVELVSTFGDDRSLAEELLAAMMSGKSEEPETSLEKFAASVTELRLRVVAALTAQATRYSKITSRERSALFVASRYLRSLRRAGPSLSTVGYLAVLKSLALALDPHTQYLTDVEAETLYGPLLSSGITGVGISLTTMFATPFGLRIDKVWPGGPAARSEQIHAGDHIAAIDGVETMLLEPDEVSGLLRGPEGSSVALTIMSPVGGDEKMSPSRVIHLVRAPLPNAMVQIDVRRETVVGKSIVTARLGNFYRGSARDLRLAIEAEKKRGAIDAMVLDLRSNPGGSLDEAVYVGGLFIKTGPIVASRRAGTELFDLKRDDDPAILYEGPLVVAISNFSASAAEIVAGSLKDLGRAVVAGSAHSFGKGTVQDLVRGTLSVPIGAIALTIAQFYTASGASTQLNGVASDISVLGPELEASQTESGRRYALPAGSVPPFFGEEERFIPSKGNMDARAATPLLARRSSARFSARVKNSKLKKITSDEQLTEIKRIAADFSGLRPAALRRPGN